MPVFSHHTRANECCQLAGHAASTVVPGTLQDHRAFPYNGILPDLADFYGSAIRRAVRGRGATFAPKSRIRDVWSATLPQSDKGRVARHSEQIAKVSEMATLSTHFHECKFLRRNSAKSVELPGLPERWPTDLGVRAPRPRSSRQLQILAEPIPRRRSSSGPLNSSIAQITTGDFEGIFPSQRETLLRPDQLVRSAAGRCRVTPGPDKTIRAARRSKACPGFEPHSPST